MLSVEARKQKAQQWFEHLQAWRARGGSLAAYAREAGLAEWQAYRWQRILEREGRWVADPLIKRARSKTSVAPTDGGGKFVQVRLTPAREPPGSLVVRVWLANGRRAEIRLTEVSALGTVLTMLEAHA